MILLRTTDPIEAATAARDFGGPTLTLLTSHLGGWRTETDLLEPYLADTTSVGVVRLDAPVPGGSLRGRVPYPIRAALRTARIGNRRRDRLIADGLEPLFAPGATNHVHCAGHLVANPVLAHLRPQHTLSVTVDAPIGATYREVLDAWYCGWGRSGLARQEAAILARSSLVIALSEWAAADCRTAVGPERVVVTTCSAHDGAPGTPLRPSIAFIGEELRRKGGDRLLRWHARHFPDAELHVFSPARRPRRLHPNVRWHGRVPNETLVHDYLPEMSVLALPTLEDFSPHVVIEAAACGVPAVTSDLAGMPEVVLHERSGLLYNRYDDAGFISGLARLLRDPVERDRMGRIARRHYEEVLAPEHNSARTAALLIEATEAAFGGTPREQAA